MRRVYLPYGEDEGCPGMDAAERRRLIQRHRYSLSEFGYSPEALFWGSRGVQKIRFKILAEIGVAAGDSLLDVGCGFADLNSWLHGHDLPVICSGIDLSADILARAAALNPGLNLSQGEVFDFDWQPQSFDWIMLSGTLNWNLHDDGTYARRVIGKIFELARKGVAFNMLDIRGVDRSLLGELAAYDAQEIFAYCQSLTPHCRLRSDYLDDDFTIYMYRA